MTNPQDDSSPLAQATFDAVIFDMDGTLIDSTAAVTRSWVRWAQEEGLDPYVLVGTQGRTARSIVAEHVAADRVEASLARVHALEVGDTEGIVLLPGAAEALQAIDGCRWALATSSARPLVKARLAVVGLPEPAVLVTADDVQNGKPAPDPFLQAAERLGVAPRHCLVVEDARNGVLAARAAGMPVMGVATTMPWHELGADVVVPDLSHTTFAAVGGRIQVTAWTRLDAEN